MKYALVNPRWSFDGSIYFGCRQAHLPLEYGYSKALLERAGHEAEIFDAQLFAWDAGTLRERIGRFRPDFLVITTAPSYLFWRCAPPELRVPQETLGAIRDLARQVVAVGPHASTTPTAALRKLGADVAVLGECEEVLPQLAERPLAEVDSIAWWNGGSIQLQGRSHASSMKDLPALAWGGEFVGNHPHHHHRFEADPAGPGAEMETSRGCPYHCSFCAKDKFRNLFRRRPLNTVLDELDGLIAQGIEYVYFVDEIFLPNEPLLKALVERSVKFGVQTRIDLWNFPQIELLGQAGCVSIEAGVESLTPEGRDLLDKNCQLSTEELTERLIYAKQHVPFVQANLLESRLDDPQVIEQWRQELKTHGVWANKPVPLFPYPGSPDYTKRWGELDERAWERAHEHYLTLFAEFSDIQEERPLPLHELEYAPVRHE